MSLNPYDAPRPEVSAAESAAQSHSPVIVRAIAIIFLLDALFELLSSFLVEPYFERLGVENVESEESLMMIGVGIMGITCVVLAVYFLGVVLFCTFIHKAHQNAQALGARGMRYSAGLAVASFFIPIANLVLPYLTVREIYQASDPDAGPDDWRTRPANMVSLWWSAWLISLLLIAVSVGIALSEDETLLRFMVWLDGVSAIVYVITALLGIKLVYEIARRQALVTTRRLPAPIVASLSN